MARSGHRKETVTVCLSEDDWRSVTVRRWTVHLVTLPNWLPPVEWIRERVHWKWAWGFGCDPTWPEPWQRYLAREVRGHPGRRLAVVKLLRNEPKSEVRRSLRAQLITWLGSRPDDRSFDTPFSPSQWGALTNRWIVQSAHRLDKSLYDCSRYKVDRGPQWNSGK